jgi:hypothetical protein
MFVNKLPRETKKERESRKVTCARPQQKVVCDAGDTAARCVRPSRCSTSQKKLLFYFFTVRFGRNRTPKEKKNVVGMLARVGVFTWCVCVYPHTRHIFTFVYLALIYHRDVRYYYDYYSDLAPAQTAVRCYWFFFLFSRLPKIFRDTRTWPGYLKILRKSHSDPSRQFAQQVAVKTLKVSVSLSLSCQTELAGQQSCVREVRDIKPDVTHVQTLAGKNKT